MKKLSLLLAALAVAFAASASMPIRGNINTVIQPKHRVIGAEQTMAAPVTAQPEGELHMFVRGTTGGYMYYSNGIGVGNQSGNVMAVYAEDGKTVWLKDIMAGAATGAWVQGEISEDGTTLTVPLYQSIYSGTSSNGEPFEGLLAWGSTTLDEEGYINFELDERTTEMTFTIEGDVLTMNYSEGAEVVDSYDDASYVCTGLALVSQVEGSEEYGWMGYMNWNTEFTDKGVVVIPEVITEQPEGELVVYNRAGNTLALEAYWFWYFVTASEQDGKVYVVYAPDGKTVYIQNILNGYSEAITSWVKGELDEEGNIHVLPGQCIYWSDQYMGGVMLTMGHVTATIDDEGFTTAEALDDEIVFAVDGNVITLLNTSALIDGDYYDVTGLTGFWSDDDSNLGSIDWNTVYTHVDAVPAVPADPENVEWHDGYNENGNSYLGFTINLVDVDGNPIVDDNTYIRIYTDNDEVFTFDPETYADSDVAEEMTDVPYTHAKYDINIKNGYVYFYRTLYNDNPFFNERIGIQVVYKVDGIENESNIVYWYRVPAVPAVPADPTADNWVDQGNENGYNRFYFTINLEDVEGNALDPGYVYYTIYTDNDEPFTFDAETYAYSGVTEDMTVMPYTLNRYDLHPSSGYVYFYRTNADGYETFFTERIGIQVHYIVDGVENSSNIVYWYLPLPPAGAVPADPVAINWHDSGDESGYSYFDFQLPEYDTEGNPLDMQYLSYSIYTDDDQIFTFDADTYYYDLNNDMTEIPYSVWSNAYDFYAARVYFYRTNEGDNPLFESRIGIQVHYKTQDGVYSSNIVYIDKYTSVDELNAGKTVAGVRYYNIAGQEMAQPQGMTIQVTTYTDGTTSTAKVVK